MILDSGEARAAWPNATFGDGCAIGHDVAIHGNVQIGRNVSICGPAEINGTGSKVVIGDGCDIASYVVINVADSHRRCVGKSREIDRESIYLGASVFIGAMSVILGGAHIDSEVVIGAMSKVAGHVSSGSVVRPLPPLVSRR